VVHFQLPLTGTFSSAPSQVVLEFEKNNVWYERMPTSILFSPFWQSKQIEYKQNNVLYDLSESK
jgi:hypothetical protein